MVEPESAVGARSQARAPEHPGRRDPGGGDDQVRLDPAPVLGGGDAPS
ncbi:MAG: hypothetical protein M3R38_13090 [Actinomycetota bacterium]|nr:hypothetical protein [Actinomycetota bacterium]